MPMQQEVDGLQQQILSEVESATSLDELEEVRLSSLGKKGRLTAMMKQLGQMQGEERKNAGQTLNVAKNAVASALEARREQLAAAAMQQRLEAERIDVTQPVHGLEMQGSIHPITRTVQEMIGIFAEMGFAVAEGPDIEDDFHNFSALNFPPNHPARQMHDTFYMRDQDAETGLAYLLRTHTSPVQARTMLGHKPPIRIIVPGRTYRSDYDQTHTPMFHQMEGLVVDEKTSMADLKGCLLDFCRKFFEVENPPMRFRPHYFPFTEPSAEVDIGCRKGKDSFAIGEGDDWLEILGCGMVHPNVLENCGIDPDKYQGYAFGMGIERLAMLKYGMPDLRPFFEPDLRWLSHYGFDPARRPDTA